MRRLIRQRLARWETAILRGFRFVGDVHFFWFRLGYGFRAAIKKAGETIY